MCDLLGMSFNVPVRANISLDLFQLRGNENPDGWGLAFYQDSHLQIVKEARPAPKSALYDFVEKYPQSRIFISHVRRSTRGSRSYVNTHPFYRISTIGHQRFEFCMAHNGTLSDMSKIELNELAPIGETDSEQLLCFLLENTSRNEPAWAQENFKQLEIMFKEINGADNTLNCILSDGEYLMCYSDENNHNGGLRFSRQEYPFSRIKLVDEKTTLGSVDIQSANVEGKLSTDQYGYVVVTRAIAGREWTSFSPGELIVFREGSIVYPTHRI